MSDGNDPQVQQEIFDSLRRLQLENYCIVASSALLFADFALTFTQEVQRIWGRRFSGATAIFLLTRYSALAERVTLLVSLFLVTVVDSDCTPVLRLDDTLTDINYVAIGTFIALRLFAVYGRKWTPLVLLGLLLVARVTLAVYLQRTYTPVAFGPPLYGCGGVWLTLSETLFFNLGTAANSLVLASDFLLIVLTWVKTFGIRKTSIRSGSSAPIGFLLLRDGTIYFLAVFIIEMFAVISDHVGSNFILFGVWPYFGQVFTTIFLSRFMLNLRGVYLPDSTDMNPGSSSRPWPSEIRFASTIIGNLGAPLETRVEEISIGSATEIPDTDDDGISVADERDSEKIEISDDPMMVGLSRNQVGVEMQEIGATS